jgi:hypothetical protein
MVDTVDGLNVREESVAEAGTLTGTLDQASDVSHSDGGANFTLGLVDLHELVEALVGDVSLSQVGVNCTEREILSGDVQI